MSTVVGELLAGLSSHLCCFCVCVSAVNQPMHLSPQQLIDSFEEAVRKLSLHPLVRTADSPAASAMHQRPQTLADPIASSGKELWQSLAQTTSQKRNPLCKKPADSGSPVGLLAGSGEKVTRDGSECGDGSCNSSTTLDAVVTEQIKSVVERTSETGAGDAVSSASKQPTPTPSSGSPSLSDGGSSRLSGGWAGWQMVDRDTTKLTDEDSPPETSAADISQVISAEDSFYSVTSGDLTAAEPTVDDDDDAVDTDVAHLNSAQPELNIQREDNAQPEHNAQPDDSTRPEHGNLC